MKNTRKLLISSLLMIVTCCVLFASTTFAWFSDSVSSNNNVITAGNLDLGVEYTLDGQTWADLDGADDLFQKSLWEPGHTEVVALRITNNGSLALKYKVNLNIAKEVIGKTKDGKDIKLSEILEVSTLAQQTGTIGDIMLELAFKGENKVGYEQTVKLNDLSLLSSQNLSNNGDAHYLLIKIDMPETIGNEANHDGVHVPSISFGVEVMATQYNHEADSFGPDYDKDAEYPLQGLPKAEVEQITTPVNAAGYDLEAIYKFIAKETAEEAQQSEFRYWHADFVVSFDADLPVDSVVLAGQYDAFSADWVAFENGTDITLAAGEEFRLLYEVGKQFWKFPYVTYETLCSDVKVFTCGAADLEDKLSGVTMTVELRLYETDPADPDHYTETGVSISVCSYSHTFR